MLYCVLIYGLAFTHLHTNIYIIITHYKYHSYFVSLYHIIVSPFTLFISHNVNLADVFSVKTE